MQATANAFVPAPAGADDETLSIILSLLGEDVRELTAASQGKGKRREGTVTDAELALQLYAEELKNASDLAADRRLTRSLQQAVKVDADAIAQYVQEERMARHDHELSLALSAGRKPPLPPGPDKETVGDADIEILAERYVNEALQSTTCADTIMCDADDDDDSDDVVFLGYNLQPNSKAESSAWAASRTLGPRRNCVACLDSVPATRTIRAPCEHDYCHGCVLNLFRRSLTDESLFPASCCRQPIPVDQHHQLLGADLVARHAERELEFSTPNRIYCHSANCAAFISPAFIEDDVAMCVRCGRYTCAICKQRSHIGVDCPQDMELQRMLQEAQALGWRRCYGCSAMVELNHGCFHITCRCRAQFCYVCGLKWKTCRCPQWEEQRLFARATQIDQRQQGGNGARSRAVTPRPGPHRVGEREVHEIDDDDEDGNAPADMIRRVRGIMDNLEQNHECDHADWVRLNGRHLCEGCNRQMPSYVFECNQCNAVACRRCRYNRRI